jgi:hypothetical protein
MNNCAGPTAGGDAAGCISVTGRGVPSRTWWAGHRVRGPRQLAKTYLHPVVGSITLDVQQFSVDTQSDQQLVAYTAPPDSPSQEALRFLLQWAARPDRANESPATQDNHRRK